MIDDTASDPSEPGGGAGNAASDSDARAAEEETKLVDLVHDLNQPLTAMTNFLAAAQIALADQNSPALVAAMLDDANTQAARARAVVRRMRAFLAR